MMDSSFGDSPLEYLLALVAGLSSSLSISGLPDIPLLAWLLILSLIYLILYWGIVVRRPRSMRRDGGEAVRRCWRRRVGSESQVTV